MNTSRDQAGSVIHSACTLNRIRGVTAHWLSRLVPRQDRAGCRWAVSRTTTMLIHRAYKTELDPTEEQKRALGQCVGTARFAYNWALRRNIEHYQATGERLSRFDLQKELTAAKGTESPWLAGVSKHIPECAIRDLESAFQHFFRRLKSGERPGFPRFKSRRDGGSFRLRAIGRISESTIHLPRLGNIRLKERGYLPTGGVKVLSATVTERAGRWFVSVNAEEERPEPAPHTGPATGVDVGLASLATLSDGTKYPNPKALKRAQRKMKRLQRVVSRRKKGSVNRRKAKAALARAHYRVSCIRADAQHKATTEITERFGLIGVEGLNVKGMLRNHCLAGAVSDAGFHELRRQLEYKAKWRGGRVVVADQWFPSSKTCSECGAVKDELKLSERVFQCSECGFQADRDVNAARNLEKLAARSAESENACGGDEVHSGSGREVLPGEAGTLIEGEIGSVQQWCRTARRLDDRAAALLAAGKAEAAAAVRRELARHRGE